MGMLSNNVQEKELTAENWLPREGQLRLELHLTKLDALFGHYTLRRPLVGILSWPCDLSTDVLRQK